MERGNILLKLGKVADAMNDFESLVGDKIYDNIFNGSLLGSYR